MRKTLINSHAHMHLMKRPSSPARDELGLSTLEWILLVAAVAGLATIGTLVVRGAVTGSEERTASNAELSGDDGQLRTLQNQVNQIFANMPPPSSSSSWGAATELTGMGRLCENPRGFVYDNSWTGLPSNFQTGVIGGRDERLDNSANVLHEMITIHADWGATYSFHFLSESQLTGDHEAKNESTALSLSAGFWCRVKSSDTGNCGNVLWEVPKENPGDSDFVDVEINGATTSSISNNLCNNLV